MHAPTEDVLLLTYATDVSATGVFVRASRPLPIGTRVTLELQQRSGARMVMDGVVVRTPASGPRGMGMAFVEVDEEARHQLERLVDRAGMQGLLTTADAEAFVFHQQK